MSLTKGEFALLSAFVDAPRRPLSPNDPLQATRIQDGFFHWSIEAQILRLRRRLEVHLEELRLIRTERGAGFLFDAGLAIR